MYKPYKEVFKHLPDFEVTYRIFSSEEGGRKTPAFQGIQWHFSYEEFSGEGCMIFPEIVKASTNEVFAPGIPIPEYGIAAMWILSPQLRPLHQKRIKVGVRGYFMEGSRKVGVCEVVRIIGLFTNPTA